MELHEVLLPPKLNVNHVTELEYLANEIINCLHSANDYRQLLNTFNQLSVRQYNIDDFGAAFGSIGMKEFARKALMPNPPHLPEITKEEYIEIIQRVASADYLESETTWWLELLNRNLPHPAIFDLIYYEDLEPEEILDKALSYKSICP